MNRNTLWMVLLVALAPVGSLAWSPVGHSIIGDIAAHYLTPRTRDAVAAILGRQTLSDYEVASWADTIRGNREYAERYPRNGSWHFVEFDVTLRYNDQFELKLPEDGNDIVSQIRRWRDELAGGKLDEETRLDALRFVVHFVGDIHQPLHCAFRYGDMGGNMLPVEAFRGRHYAYDGDTAMDYPSNVHSVWDDAMVSEMMAGKDWNKVARQLREEITPSQLRWWSSDDPYIWAVDSYWRARKDVYRWADGTNLPYKWTRPGMTLTSENYIDAKLPIVSEQLQKGGVRLAHTLNLAFDPDYTGPAAAEASEGAESAQAAE